MTVLPPLFLVAAELRYHNMWPTFEKLKDSILPVAVAFIAPVKTLLIATIVLVFIDLILGVIAAKRRGELIESRKLRASVKKFLSYEAAIVVGHLVQVYFTPELPVMALTSSVIGLSELKSVLENLTSISGVDFVQQITGRLTANANPASNAPSDPKAP